MPAKKKRSAPAKASEDFSGLTVAQLKAECKKKGLEATGTKKALLSRLEDEGDSTSSGPPAKMKKQSTLQKAMVAMKESAKADSAKKKTHKVDPQAGLNGAEVFKDFDCMLNQTNIGNNNNKYYVIQVIKYFGNYYSFNRWGRVGEPGQKKLTNCGNDSDDAVQDFKKKFQDKTKNAWESRNKFKPVPGKYTLLEMGGDDDEDNQVVAKPSAGLVSKNTKACSLDAATQAFIKLIFNNDMFKEALLQMDIDVKKMPLGKLSKSQIVKGFEVLDDIKSVMDKKSKGNLTELSNQFYTVIPQDFGRQRPPVINTQDELRKKLDMLLTLGDIEMAQDMLKTQDKKAIGDGKASHPLDEHYKMLQCTLTHLKAGDKEYKILEKYAQSTGGYRTKKLLHIWRIDRHSEGQRFKQHDGIKHRKLLWHGTNVAVVAAILKSGLRIMPHSGGLVGKGIYFASENSKSAGYVRPAKNTGIMFLNEVALGKEHSVFQCDGSLTRAPAGFDSIVARGRLEPDPKKDETLKLEGKPVIVPQAPPVNQSQWSKSGFYQSEYLVYKESQVRMRYALEFQFDY